MSHKKIPKKKPLDSSELNKATTATKLNIPQDVFMGTTIISIQGNNNLLIENYRGLIEYKDECILIQGKKCNISISGLHLEISYYSNTDMNIKGIIKKVEFITSK